MGRDLAVVLPLARLEPADDAHQLALAEVLARQISASRFQVTTGVVLGLLRATADGVVGGHVESE